MDKDDVPVEHNLDAYVQTAEFDLECRKEGLKSARSSSNERGSSGDERPWSSDGRIASATTVEPRPYDVPKLEANLYYAGVGPKEKGPKLIYRTSKDVFEEPSGPEAYTRLMRVVAVPDTHDFGTNVTWDAIRDQVRGLLATQQALCSRFVHRSWCSSTRGTSKSHRLISFDLRGSTRRMIERSPPPPHPPPPTTTTMQRKSES